MNGTTPDEYLGGHTPARKDLGNVGLRQHDYRGGAALPGEDEKPLETS